MAMKSLVIFDSFSGVDARFLRGLIKQQQDIFVLEPFIAYHHTRQAIAGFPKGFPEFIKLLIQSGELKVISAKDFDAKTIYGQAVEAAVEAVEAVFEAYEKRFAVIIRWVCVILKSKEAKNAFKNYLSQRLAEFYALNILLYRLQKKFPQQLISFYSDVNIRQYYFLFSLLKQTRQKYFEHTDVHFPMRMFVDSLCEQVRIGFFMFMVLFFQSLFGFVMDFVRVFDQKGQSLKKYKYGITIIAPNRQLKNTYGRADFLIDNKIINGEDVVYLPLSRLSSEQKELLSNLSGSVYYLPNPREYFSDGLAWLRLFCAGLRDSFLFNGGELKTAYLVLSRYFLWKAVLKEINIKHLVTHCDFGVNHIGRNIALSETGTKTWYFTDSMNLGCSWQQDDICPNMRHPFWTYLTYDHFVTWSEAIREFFQLHPTGIKQYHVVGCLWSQSESRGDQVFEFSRRNFDPDNKFFIIGAFDTTYSLNGFATYDEGILFAQHLLKLVEHDKDIFVVLKEKKDRKIHGKLDPQVTPKFLKVYDEIDKHPRIKVLSRLANTGELLDNVDMVVSFPFTSTTFEALSRNIPAIWHDPLGYYQNMPYGKLGNVMTCGFVDFNRKVHEIKTHPQKDFFAQLNRSSKLLDPFSDKKSVDRFRQLLAQA